MTIHTTDSRIGATVLAALRLWQQTRPNTPADLADIATNGGRLKFMGAAKLDQLCEELNCGGAVLLPGADAPMILSADDMALIISGVGRYAGNGPMGNLMGHKADCEELAGRLDLFKRGAIIADAPPILRPETLARIEAGREKFGLNGPPVAAILAELDAKAVAWAARQAPEGADNDTQCQEEADTVLAVLGELRAFITGAPAKPAPDAVLWQPEGCEPFTYQDGQAAAEMGWCINEFSDGQLCIVADDDMPEIFSGKSANLDAHAHVEAAAAQGLYTSDKYAPMYVETCRRALAICKATEPLPRWAVQLIAKGVQVTADDESDAERHAAEDAREFMGTWAYRLSEVRPSEDEPMDDAGEIIIELGSAEQVTDWAPPEPGPIAESVWTYSPTFHVVVEAANRPAAVVEALRLLGVEDPRTTGSVLWVELPEQVEVRERILAQPQTPPNRERDIFEIARTVGSRTPEQIVQAAEELARMLASLDGRELAAGATFHGSDNPQVRQYWTQACTAMAFLQATDPQDALSEIE